MKHTSRAGFTLMEIIIVVVIIGIIMAVAFPRVADGLRRQRVHNAVDAIASMYAKTRAIAIQRGSYAYLGGMPTGNLRILTQNPLTGFFEWVGQYEDVAARYDVSVSHSLGSGWYYLGVDYRGVGLYPDDTVTVTAGPYTRTLKISRWGRIEK